MEKNYKSNAENVCNECKKNKKTLIFFKCCNEIYLCKSDIRKKFDKISSEGEFRIECSNCETKITFELFSNVLDEEIVKRLKINKKKILDLKENKEIQNKKIKQNNQENNKISLDLEETKEIETKKINKNKNINIYNINEKKKITNIINCEFCKIIINENYEDYDNLNCGHTICLQCIAYAISKKFINKTTYNIFDDDQIIFFCPKCSKEVSLSHLTDDLFNKIINLSNREIYCDLCNKNKTALFRCKTDLKNFCFSCYKLYNNKDTKIKFKDHMIERASKSRKNLNCSFYLINNCKIYGFCYDCKTIICFYCQIKHRLTSKDHKFILIDDNFLIKNSFVEKKINLKFIEMSQIIQKELNDKIEIIKNFENKKNLAFTRIVNEIKKKLDDIVANSIEKTNCYIQEIEKKKDIIYKCYKNLGNMEKTLTQIECINMDQLFNFEKLEIKFDKFEINNDFDFGLPFRDILNNLNNLQENLKNKTKNTIQINISTTKEIINLDKNDFVNAFIQKKPSSEVPLIKCIMCLRDVEVSHCITNIECDHKFCKNCMTEICLSSIKEKILIFCPHNDCKKEIDIEIVKDLLPREKFSEYDQFITNKALYNTNNVLKNDEKLVYCKYCDIYNIIDKYSTNYKCYNCNRQFCANNNCNLLWQLHNGKSCNQLKEEDINEENFKHLKKNNGWRNCPKCNIVVEKIKFCNYIRCESKECLKKTIFCYLCGEKLDEETKEKHFIDNNTYMDCIKYEKIKYIKKF